MGLEPQDALDETACCSEVSRVTLVNLKARGAADRLGLENVRHHRTTAQRGRIRGCI